MDVRALILTAGGAGLLAGAAGGALGAWLVTRAPEAPSLDGAPGGSEITALEARLAALEATVEWSAFDDPQKAGVPTVDVGAQDPAETPPAPDARRAVEAALGEDTPRFVELLQALQNESDPAARIRAARQLLESERPGMRMRGLLELLQAGEPEGIEAAVGLVEGSVENPRAEGLAARAIGMLGNVDDPRVDAHLYDFLERDGAIRREAATALEKRGDPVPVRNYIESVAPDLQSRVTRERLRAVKELGDTRSAQAAPLIEPMLRDPDPIVRQAAIPAIALTASDRAPDLLKPLLSDPIPIVRDAAARTIDNVLDPPRGGTFFFGGDGPALRRR